MCKQINDFIEEAMELSEPPNKDVQYGRRLLPQLVDDKAQSNPAQLMGMIAKSSDLSQGFFEFSYKDIANAVNFISWWLIKKMGPPSAGRNTIAYMVGSFYQRTASTNRNIGSE